MKLALSTLGCPDWDLDRICGAGTEPGFHGVGLRGYLEEVEVTRHPRFTEQIEETQTRLDESGLAANAIDSGISGCYADPLGEPRGGAPTRRDGPGARR